MQGQFFPDARQDSVRLTSRRLVNKWTAEMVNNSDNPFHQKACRQQCRKWEQAMFKPCMIHKISESLLMDPQEWKPHSR